MKNTRLIRRVALGAALALTACGGGDNPAAEPSSHTPASETPANNPASEQASSVALPTTPLNRDALFGLTSETVVETAPCPFLSDATALATADRTGDLIRREVSNQECRWSKNAGFSVVASAAPIATATPLKDRAYNLETPPVIKDQPGPGDGAVILYDTAWETERPYAMGFQQGDNLVTIFVTGLQTSAAQLTAAAEEIAAKLPVAPTIEAQRREILPAMNFCDIWSDETIAALSQSAQDSGMYSSAYGATGCKWSAGYGASAKSVTLARYKQGDTNLANMLKNGGAQLSGLGDQAVILTRGPSDGYAGDTTIWVDTEDQQFNLTLSGTIPDHAEHSEKLMRNLFSRF